MLTNSRYCIRVLLNPRVRYRFRCFILVCERHVPDYPPRGGTSQGQRGSEHRGHKRHSGFDLSNRWSHDGAHRQLKWHNSRLPKCMYISSSKISSRSTYTLFSYVYTEQVEEHLRTERTLLIFSLCSFFLIRAVVHPIGNGIILASGSNLTS